MIESKDIYERYGGKESHLVECTKCRSSNNLFLWWDSRSDEIIFYRIRCRCGNAGPRTVLGPEQAGKLWNWKEGKENV